MTREELLARISLDEDVCFGKPCIRGTRICVSLVLDWLASGSTAEDVLREYPALAPADVLACIAYGAGLASGRYFDVPLESKA